MDLHASANMGLIGVISCKPTSLEFVDLLGLPELYFLEAGNNKLTSSNISVRLTNNHTVTIIRHKAQQYLRQLTT